MREEAEKKFKLIGEAHSVLSDPQKRQQYDSGWSLEEINQGAPESGMGGFGGMDMEDVYAQMFSSGGVRFGGSGGFPRGAYTRR